MFIYKNKKGVSGSVFSFFHSYPVFSFICEFFIWAWRIVWTMLSKCNRLCKCWFLLLHIRAE